PGVAAISLLEDDRTVRYVGQQIAAVAAQDRQTARAALAAIKLSWTTLPSVVGLDAARRPDSPVAFTGSRKNAGNVSEGSTMPVSWKHNVRGPSAAFSHKAKKARGWVAAARSAHDPLLVEGIFRTGTQSHTCLEPHAAVARFDGEQLTVHVSTQAVFELRTRIAQRFKLDADKIRVVAEHIGGG